MSWGYRPQLDGLRAVAVYLVLVYHAGLALAAGGFIGVDLFFVLSGFLVSNVVWDEVDRTGGFRVGSFYARRVRRLLPAALVAIVATCVVQVLVSPLASRLDMVDDARAALLYFANWHFVGDAGDYFAQGDAPSPFLHFWSLSLEEQYYVAYPLLCWLVVRGLRRGERTFATILGVVMVASVAAQVWVARDDAAMAYYGTHTRVYQILAGALLAVALRALARKSPAGPDSAPVRVPAPVRVLAPAGLVALLALGSDLAAWSPSTRGLLATVASVAVIAGLTLTPVSLVSRGLATRPIRYLGQISYGTYLWHWPVILTLREVVPTRPLVTAALAAVLASSLAALSFELLETPIRRTPRLRRVPWPVVGAGLAVSATAALVVVGPVLQRPHTPAAAVADTQGPELGGSLSWTRKPVPKDLPFQRLVDDRGELGADCADGTPRSCVVVDGPDRDPLVVLVGDSHAGMLLPALRRLADEQGFRLSTNIRNKCAWIQGIHNATERDAVNDPCREQRRAFYDEILPAMDADVVLLAQRSRDGADVLLEDVVADEPSDADGSWHQMMLSRARGTLDKIEASGARALIVHSMLTTNGWQVSGSDPLDCLSAARTQGDCAVVPVLPPRLDSLFDYLSVSDPDVFTAELRDAYCPSRVLCAPIVDGLVTWKDRSHLSSDYTVAIRRDLWAALGATGAFAGLDLS